MKINIDVRFESASAYEWYSSTGDLILSEDYLQFLVSQLGIPGSVATRRFVVVNHPKLEGTIIGAYCTMQETLLIVPLFCIKGHRVGLIARSDAQRAARAVINLFLRTDGGCT